MSGSESGRAPEGSFDSWGTRISQWIRQLSLPEQKALCAEWLLRKRADARKKLEELFCADFIDALLAKMDAFRRELGGEFVQNEGKLRSMLFIYMVSLIPESVREETRLLVDAVLAGRPIARG
ncbi:MAG: hypothetical protein Q7S29_00955 [Candidatus Peribacter sp.]|nr:hypothetical protein [Candidatus Peribacter sp.]